ncbi:MAG TPA: GNAT family N-acetyltransferase [Opitutaceae bacterium]|nr:GNAT family N-acetyltransferase [Opitutaceae bacterium]
MEAISALEHGLAPTAAVLDRAFSDYFVNLPASSASLLSMVRHDSVDLAASRVWFCGGQAAGVLLHAQRGWSGRLAAMGVTPEARRRGLGAKMVTAWLDDCRARGIHELTLEVIGTNTAARRLYEMLGFSTTQRLAGWRKLPTQIAKTGTPRNAEPVEIDPRALARFVAAQDPAGTLPWQIAAETLAQFGRPWTAWQLATAAVLVSDIAAPVITVRALGWHGAQTDLAQTAELLRALAALHPAHTWRAPAIFPETWAAAFTNSGWEPDTIDQWQMALSLRR